MSQNTRHRGAWLSPLMEIGDSLSGGPDIARTSHIGSATSFIHSKAHFYQKMQPNLTCNTPQTHHTVKCFTEHNDYANIVTLCGNVKSSPGQLNIHLYECRETGLRENEVCTNICKSRMVLAEIFIWKGVFYITNEMQLIQYSLLLSALYMFRAVFPPIIRSLWNCMCSLG